MVASVSRAVQNNFFNLIWWDFEMNFPARSKFIFIGAGIHGSSTAYMKELSPCIVVAAYPPRQTITARTLAELLTSTIEGGYVMANALNDARWNQRQLEGFRQHLKLLFAPDTRV